MAMRLRPWLGSDFTVKVFWGFVSYSVVLSHPGSGSFALTWGHSQAMLSCSLIQVQIGVSQLGHFNLTGDFNKTRWHSEGFTFNQLWQTLMQTLEVRQGHLLRLKGWPLVWILAREAGRGMQVCSPRHLSYFLPSLQPWLGLSLTLHCPSPRQPQPLYRRSRTGRA